MFYEVKLAECCNPINPGQVREFFIQIKAGPELFGRSFSLVIGAVGEGEVAPLVAYTDFAAFDAATGPLEPTITFPFHPENSCDGASLLANPLVIQGVSFQDDPCLVTGFNVAANSKGLVLNGPPAALPPRSVIIVGAGGAMLTIRNESAVPFEVVATDGLGDKLSIVGTTNNSGPTFAGFTSGAGIDKIEVLEGSILLTNFDFEN